MQLNSLIAEALQRLENLCIKEENSNDLNVKKETPFPGENYNIPPAWWYEQDEDGDTYLHFSIMNRKAKAARILIGNAPSVDNITTLNLNGQSPLYMAVETKQPHIVRWLIIAGANPNERLNGNTHLHAAVERGDLECCKALMDPVKEVEKISLGVDKTHRPRYLPNLNQWNRNGQTCLHLASEAGHLDIVKYLIENGADVNAREGTGGYTALHCAVVRGREDVATFLLEKCNDLDVEAKTYGGKTIAQLECNISGCLAESFRRRGFRMS